MTLPRSTLRVAGATVLVALAACGEDATSITDPDVQLSCTIPEESILSGARKDAIPALTNPKLALEGQPGTEYLRDDDRVIGIVLDGKPIAIPLNIMWWHEVVNLDGESARVAVTHCPLTGSSLAFDRSVVGGAEFGVSGLLYQTNLIMYDRSGASESLWPQMLRGARCGPSRGASLRMVPIVETTWRGWRWLHPGSAVVTDDTGYDRNYTAYPYGTYDREGSDQLLFPINDDIDRRRPPKERVLGIPDGTGGIAFPFGELDALGEAAVVSGSTSSDSFVVLWERLRQGAMAFRPFVDGEGVTLMAVGGKIVDAETGSEWAMDGRALFGPLKGKALEPIEDAYVSFWFAWPAFHPDTELWSAS